MTGFGCFGREKKGVSLLEGVIGIFLTLIAFVALFKMFSFGYFSLRNAKTHLSAVYLCQEEIERLMGLVKEQGYDALEEITEGYSQPVVIDLGPDPGSSEDDLNGTRSVSFEPWVVGTDTVGRLVFIEVSWMWQSKLPQEYLLTGLADLDD